MKNQHQAGFTLIEIVIALAIVGVGVLAISNAMSAHTNMAADLETRLMASWVASNHMAEVRFDAKTNKVKTGSRSETYKMGGRSWRSKARIEETDVERVFKVIVEVRDDANPNDKPYARLTSAISDSF